MAKAQDLQYTPLLQDTEASSVTDSNTLAGDEKRAGEAIDSNGHNKLISRQLHLAYCVVAVETLLLTFLFGLFVVSTWTTYRWEEHAVNHYPQLLYCE